MKDHLKCLTDYSGKKCQIYSLIPSGETEHLFAKFVEDNWYKYSEEIKELNELLHSISNYGARPGYFKLQSKRHEQVFHLRCRMLRLYLFRIDENHIVLGGGGVKPLDCKKWQHSPLLKPIVENLISFSNDFRKIRKGIELEELLKQLRI